MLALPNSTSLELGRGKRGGATPAPRDPLLMGSPLRK
jgi:hypothetical protein